MLTRNVRAKVCPEVQDGSSGTDDEICRMCLLERETFSHIYKCWEVVQIFEVFSNLARKLGTPISNSEPMRVLGLTSDESIVPGTLSDLHIIVWKFVILHMVRVETDKVKFDRHEIWRCAIRRQEGRLQAHAERTRRRVITKGGLPALEMQRLSAEVAPLAEYNDSGNLVPAAAWSDELERMRMSEAVNRRRPRR